MKRLYIVILSIMLFSSSYAQNHLKFMGIPLDGTINQFQAKLAAKGVTLNVPANKHVSVGARAFKGSFSGKNAQIFVYYDESSKVVYRAKVVIDTDDINIWENNYNYFVNMLSTKYSDAQTEKGKHENKEALSFLVPNDELALYKYLGIIDVYRSTDLYTYTFFVHVDYIDTVNNVKHENRNMEDL